MAEIRDAVESVVQQHLGRTFPACAISVYHRGRPILDAAWGWIDPETKHSPVTPDTRFDLASLTKLFTATVFLSLVSQGKVSLDDPLIRVVPEFGADAPRAIDGGQDPHTKQRQAVDPAFAGQTVDPARVTFRHLLTHTSGLPPWRDVYNVAGPAPAPPERDEPTPRAARWARGLAALCTYPFVGLPDGIVRYSDIGLMLLGEAVARLDGSGDLKTAIRQRVIDTFPRFFQRHLTFNPIRDHLIVHAQIAPTENDLTWRRRRVWGEVHDENACGLGGVTGHAGLFGAAYTVAALGQAWLDGAAQFGISAEVARAALTQQAESDGQRRGLGFALKAHGDSSAGERMGARTFGHTGFTGTSLWVDPDARLVVAVLTNSVYYGRASQAYADTHPFRRAIHDAIAAACRVGSVLD